MRLSPLKSALLFCAIFKIWKQNLPLKCAICDVFSYPMFANCVHTKTMFIHVSEREIFFSLNCSKFAVECDSNSKNSQNVQNLGFFGKIDAFFRKKNLQIFQNRYMWQIFSRMRLNKYFFLKMSFHLIFEVFLAKNQKKFKVGKVREYDEETEYFETKTFSSF